MSDHVVVRLFGPAREIVGAGSIELPLPRGGTAAAILTALEADHPGLAGLLPRSRVAVDLEYVDRETPLAPGNEIAILPPVGGG